MTATLTRYAEPSYPEYLDRVVVMLAVRGRFDRIGRELSDAEAVAALGPLLDRVDEAFAAGFNADGAVGRFVEFMGWSNATKAAFEQRARPNRVTVRSESASRRSIQRRKQKAAAAPRTATVPDKPVAVARRKVPPPCTATEHGSTATAYRKKRCRCPAARAAWSAYMTDYQARRREAA